MKPKEIKSFVRELGHLAGMDVGWGNGYVCLPVGHPAYGMDYDTIDEEFSISAHGGLTFAESAKNLGWKEIPSDCKECWIVGFDCAHYGDSLSNWPKAMVELEAKSLAKKFEKLLKRK